MHSGATRTSPEATRFGSGLNRRYLMQGPHPFAPDPGERDRPRCTAACIVIIVGYDMLDGEAGLQLWFR